VEAQAFSLPETFRLVLGLTETPAYWLTWCFPCGKADGVQSLPFTIVNAYVNEWHSNSTPHSL